MVANALGRIKCKKNLVKDVQIFARLGVWSEDSPKGGYIVHYNYEYSSMVDVKYKQHLDILLVEYKEYVLSKLSIPFSQGGDGVLRYQGILCVPNFYILRGKIMEEAHGYGYSIPPGATKMYRHL